MKMGFLVCHCVPNNTLILLKKPTLLIVVVTGSLLHDGEVDGDGVEQDEDADDDPLEAVSTRSGLASIPQNNVTDEKSYHTEKMKKLTRTVVSFKFFQKAPTLI